MTPNELSPDSKELKMDATTTLISDGKIADRDSSGSDALILPGAPINRDLLRRTAGAADFIGESSRQHKPAGAIRCGPWALMEAGAARDRTLAAVQGLKTEIRKAGGEWVDEDVPVDREDSLLVGGRNDTAVEQFADTLVHTLRSAA